MWRQLRIHLAPNGKDHEEYGQAVAEEWVVQVLWAYLIEWYIDLLVELINRDGVVPVPRVSIGGTP